MFLKVIIKILINQISIVIPALNEEESIPSLVDELNAELESANLEFEIIIVDDGSTDNTTTSVISPAILIKTDGRLGAGAARNLGASKATGDILLFTVY